MSNYYILTNLLSDDERRVITSIVRHIELGGNKVGIQQIASENYVSTAFIMKLCKRLGFAGYSELYYNLAQSSGEGHRSSDPDPLCGLIDGYTPEQAEQFCKMLMQYKERKIFVVGEGAARLLADFGVRLAMVTCGPKGCLLQNAGAAVRVAAPRVLPVDTTGAGDIFGGSAVSRLLQLGRAPEALTEDELTAIGRFAATAASLSTQYPGGISAIVPEETVLRCMEG